MFPLFLRFIFVCSIARSILTAQTQLLQVNGCFYHANMI